MILVTGGTGTVGRELLGRLGAGRRVRVMARDPARVARLVQAVEVTERVETVAADYGDARSLAAALQGVRTAFLVTTDVTGGDDERFLDAAVRAGVRRVVKLSAAAVLDEQADDLITRWQRGCEELLRGSGLEWTLLRPRAFTSNALAWAPSIRSARTVRVLYGTSPSACVDPRDVAAVAARVLTEEGHAGRAYALTGPESVTAAEQTEQLSRLLRVRLRCEELSLDEARAALARRYPAPVAEALLQSAQRQRAGAKAGVTDTVAALTGGRAGSFGGWARDHLAAFVPGG
ncbi:NAD(P)H-binding protein [Streptomyces sp. NPDC002766]|uniref:NAD(P)H-binding protein n=1 Tax=Streptomyces sp. NPDC002766 TaxID=3154429 RepID=UPI003323DFE1